MKVLITGVNGFIGRHLALLCLCSGHEVLGIDIIDKPFDAPVSSFYRFCQLDVLDASKLYGILLEYSPQIIFNLAANVDVFDSRPCPYSVNYLPLTVILDYVNDSRAVLVHASSMLVCPYGKVTDSAVLDDLPSTFYGISKMVGEQILLQGHNSRNKHRIRIVRLTTIWGPGMYGPIVSLFTKTRILFSSNGFKGLKTFCYVSNCCQDLLEVAVNPDKYNIISLSGDSPYVSSGSFINSAFSARKAVYLPCLRLVRVPIVFLRLLGLACDLFPRAYEHLRFNSFHLANQINPNIVSPLVADRALSPRVSFHDAMIKTVNYYYSR